MKKSQRSDASMIHVIYGKKGSGKSKKLLDMANAEVESATGNIVYLDDNNRCMYDLKYQIRFINTSDYSIDTIDKLYGFVCGILSRDFDISSVYIDSIKMMIGKEDDPEQLIKKLEKVFDGINAYIVISGSEDVPEHLKKYVI
jgi:energy-coupling factor transporter ATP-binding protein EcfA2